MFVSSFIYFREKSLADVCLGTLFFVQIQYACAV